MLIPSGTDNSGAISSSLSRRVNANSQLYAFLYFCLSKLIKKGEC